MPNANFLYNRDLDSLVVFRNKKTHASVELGEIVIDLDKQNNVVAVEILNPDQIFGIPKKLLAGIKSASMRSVVRGGVLWVNLLLKIHNVEERIPIAVPLRTS